MTHLTATAAAAAHGKLFAVDNTAPSQGLRVHFLRLASDPGESVFDSPVANFLELCDAPFHYSVIGGDALATLASGLAECHLLYDEIAAPAAETPKMGDETAGGCAQAGQAGEE